MATATISNSPCFGLLGILATSAVDTRDASMLASGSLKAPSSIMGRGSIDVLIQELNLVVLTRLHARCAELCTFLPSATAPSTGVCRITHTSGARDVCILYICCLECRMLKTSGTAIPFARNIRSCHHSSSVSGASLGGSAAAASPRPVSDCRVSRFSGSGSLASCGEGL